MQRIWFWQNPGVDGHYPNGAWFYQDTEPTPHAKLKDVDGKPLVFKVCHGTIVESTIEKRKGTFYTQCHGVNRPAAAYYETLDAAKSAIEAWANKKIA